MRLSGRVVALGATCALLGACTGESPETVASASATATATATATQSTGTATPSVAPPSAEAEAPSESAGKIADAIAVGGDPDAVRKALTFTAAGSLAHAYLLHRSYVAEAGLDSGTPYTDSEISELPGGGYRLCDDPADDSTCTVLGDFKVDATGKIVDFTVDGQGLQGRLTVGNGQKVSAGGGEFTFLTAYKAPTSNSLFVAIRMESGKKSLSPNISLATYLSLSANGQQRAASRRARRHLAGSDQARCGTVADANAGSIASGRGTRSDVSPGGKRRCAADAALHRTTTTARAAPSPTERSSRRSSARQHAGRVRGRGTV